MLTVNIFKSIQVDSDAFNCPSQYWLQFKLLMFIMILLKVLLCIVINIKNCRHIITSTPWQLKWKLSSIVAFKVVLVYSSGLSSRAGRPQARWDLAASYSSKSFVWIWQIMMWMDAKLELISITDTFPFLEGWENFKLLSQATAMLQYVWTWHKVGSAQCWNIPETDAYPHTDLGADIGTNIWWWNLSSLSTMYRRSTHGVSRCGLCQQETCRGQLRHWRPIL